MKINQNQLFDFAKQTGVEQATLDRYLKALEQVELEKGENPLLHHVNFGSPSGSAWVDTDQLRAYFEKHERPLNLETSTLNLQTSKSIEAILTIAENGLKLKAEAADAVRVGFSGVTLLLKAEAADAVGVGFCGMRRLLEEATAELAVKPPASIVNPMNHHWDRIFG